MLYGDNGILNKAKYASEEYKNKGIQEKNELNTIDTEIASLIEGNRNDILTTGYSEDTGFYYQIFSNKFCILYQNYNTIDTESNVVLNFPYEFIDIPVCQVTKISKTTSSNNIIVDANKNTVLIDTNYGYTGKCSFAITVFGIIQ